ncbi:L-fuculose-phosphate aldolase [Enterococcus cecorum]|nr:L-fuculose-phosphate aldolase [Enterococcus cecorum]
MLDQDKQNIIDYGNKLIEQGYTLGTGGNISQFIKEKNIMLITPSGIPFEDMNIADIIEMTLDGTVISNTNLIPSSEWQMHAIFYKKRKDINCLIHAHTTYSTAYATLRKTLPASHYMLAVAGTDVHCANYASYGTKELAVNAFQAMKDRKAVLLANHGILTGGSNIKQAFNVLEQVEYCTKIHFIASCMGKPIILPNNELENMIKRFVNYGQPQNHVIK